MKVRLLFTIFILPNILFSQEDLPFQVMVARNATIYDKLVQPLQYIDDVTNIEINDGGFLVLVHKSGTTYEINSKIFTFYLKPEAFKNRDERPQLEVLYKDSVVFDQTKMITALYPPFDRSGILIWNQNEDLKVYWHLYDEPVLNYVITVSEYNGDKIQDFMTRTNSLTLKPATYGLSEPIFNFKLSSSFAGETIESKTYTVELKPGGRSVTKASDLVLKALDLELNPVLGLKAWQEVLGAPNGKEYFGLFEKFLIRNENVLIAAGEDVQQLLSQNK